MTGLANDAPLNTSKPIELGFGDAAVAAPDAGRAGAAPDGAAPDDALAGAPDAGLTAGLNGGSVAPLAGPFNAVRGDSLAAERDELGLPDWSVKETLRRGWNASPELRKGAAVTVALAIVGTAGRLALPVMLQLSIDHGLRRGSVNIGLIWRIAGAGVVAVVLSQWAAWLTSRRLGRGGEAALATLRRQVVTHIHKLSVSQLAELRRGSLVARATSDLENLSQFIVWGGLIWLLDGSLMIVTAVVMAVYNPMLAAIVIVVSAPLLLLLRSLQRHLLAAYGLARQRNAIFLTGIGELTDGAPVLRVYRAEHARAARVAASAHQLRTAHVRSGTISALLFPTGEMFSCFAIAAVVVVGVSGVIGERPTAGALVGFIFLAYRFLEPIKELIEVLDQTQTAVTGWRRALGLFRGHRAPTCRPAVA
jgi:ATP-binding cassette, subfamily B, bacterial